MIVAGIDVGGKNVYIVITKRGQILGKITGPTGIRTAKVVEQLYSEVLVKAGLKRPIVDCVVATGVAARSVSFANAFLTVAAADALGTVKAVPSARTVIDVGAEAARAIRIDSKGKVIDFAGNEKCAAGTGTFIDAMARALEVSLDEMSNITLQSTRNISITAQCAVFGESEVVSLIHQKTPKPDIARAIINAVAGRAASLARIVGLEQDVVVVGGIAKNTAFVDCFKTSIEMNVIVPENPEYVGAYGAAEAALAGVITEEAKSAQKSDRYEKDAPGQNVMREAAKIKEFWRWPETNWVNPDIDWKKGKTITAGVDVGSVSSQAVIMVDGEYFASGNTRTGSNSPISARKAMNYALERTGMTVENIDYCIGTGYGRVNVPMAQQSITEISCHARGANFMYGPDVRTVMDIGGQDSKAITIDDHGKLLNFIMNDKCAAGTGRAMEVFADLIQVPVWEIGPRSYLIEKEPPMISSTCVVLANSEVISLLGSGMSENDIMAAYCSAMAHRIAELLNRLGVSEKLVITGGIAKNEGVVKRLEKELGIRTADRIWYKKEYNERGYPFDTQLAGAMGAALYGYAFLTMGRVKSTRKV